MKQAMCTHLSKHGSVYYFCCKIPLDVLPHYGSKKEIMRSLRTSDRREAEGRARELGVQLDREFAGLRASPSSGKTGVSNLLQTEIASLKAINVDAVASAYLAHIRRARDEAAAVGDEALERFMEIKRYDLAWHESILHGKTEPTSPLAHHEAQRNALKAFLTGDGSVRTIDVSAAAGGLTTLVQATSGTGAATALSIELFDLVDRWATEKQPKAKTVSRTRSIVREFVKRSGVALAAQITRQHVLSFKDALLEDKESAANINIKLAMLGILFNYASDNDLGMSSNPAAKIRVADKRRAKDKRREFDTVALNAIFTSVVYSEGLRPKGGGGEAAYWLPLLALFTGARIEELAQLRPEDVYEEGYTDSHGTERKAWVLRITGDQTAGQDIKTESSERRVPLHAELLRSGFVKYVQAAQGHSRIFYQLRRDSQGSESGNYSKWFGRYLRGPCKVTDERMVFHSFRHTFKHLARLADISTEVNNALTGHITGEVADNYGGLSYPLAPLVNAIQRYRVPGVTLPAPSLTSDRMHAKAERDATLEAEPCSSDS